MPRHSRIKADDLVYHVITRGNNKMRAFHSDDDYNKYLDILRKYKKEIPFELYNFCLMMNHPHLLIKPNFDISKLMHRINLSYAQYYKFKYKHIGHFWQDRFKSYIVSRDEYMLMCARYIETNPERTTQRIPAEKYPYSSYRYYAYGEKCDIITRNLLYNSFGLTEEERRLNYIKFVKDKEANTNLEITKSQFIASQAYINNLLKRFKDQMKLKRKRGRPRKVAHN